VSMAKKRQPAQSCKPAQTRKPGVAVKIKSLVSDESAATHRTSKKRAVPKVSAPVESDAEAGSSSDEDDRANLSLAERLAQRGRAAVGGLVKSSSGAGSSNAKVLSSSLIPSFSSPVPQSKRPRARKGSAVVDMCSPSPAQAKKKTRVFSPVEAKPKKQSVLNKKPAARGNVKSKVVAKRLEPESEPDEQEVSVHEKSDCDVDCENAMEDKKPLARPRRGGTKKPIVVESSSEDENDDGASDFEGDDDDDDSDFE
jgi:hypothetical protein